MLFGLVHVRNKHLAGRLSPLSGSSGADDPRFGLSYLTELLLLLSEYGLLPFWSSAYTEQLTTVTSERSLVDSSNLDCDMFDGSEFETHLMSCRVGVCTYI